MKKLMVAAAIVCAAVMSHGAACSWNISGTGALGNPTGVTLKNITNPTMYIYMTTAAQTALVSERNALLAALKANDTPTGWVEKYDLTNGNLAPQTLPTDSTVGANYSFYGVVIGADEAGNEYAFFTLSAMNKTAALATDGGTSVSLTQSATSLKGIDVTAAGSSAWYQIKEGAVPEPTSGLLLLLGVAGLALKRKRA